MFIGIIEGGELEYDTCSHSRAFRTKKNGYKRRWKIIKFTFALPLFIRSSPSDSSIARLDISFFLLIFIFALSKFLIFSFQIMSYTKWNRTRLAKSLDAAGSDVEWGQEHGLLPTTKQCPTHRKEMKLSLEADRWGRFRCWKSGGRSSRSITEGTWFEDVRIPLATVLRLVLKIFTRHIFISACCTPSANGRRTTRPRTRR